MASNKKRDRYNFFILDILNWIIFFVILFHYKDPGIVLLGFIILILIDIYLFHLGRKIKSQHKEK